MNVRGNYESQFNTKISNSSSAFWDFTFEDMATMDLPATLDFVLDTAKKEKLH